jgi:hypothetical protein
MKAFNLISARRSASPPPYMPTYPTTWVWKKNAAEG